MEAAREPLAAAKAYEVKKRSYLNTEAECDSQGIQFTPMVLESSGALGPEAAKVLGQIAAARANRDARDGRVVMAELLQQVSITVRRANAQATLKRQGGEGGSGLAALCTATAVLALEM